MMRMEAEMLFARYAPGIDVSKIKDWTLEELHVRRHFLEKFLQNEREL